MVKLPVKEIEEFVREETRDVASVMHDFDHLKRTAIGAIWFLRLSKASEEEEELAYIAGLLHDIVRPASEKVCHAEASAKRSAEILRDFNVPDKEAKRILEAIACHRKKHEWRDSLHQSIFFVDKVLEQMGDYVVFRRCMYIGECRDYKDTPFRETVISHFRERLEMFTASEFEPRFSRLVEYQHKKVVDFWKAFKKGKEWAVKLARFSYDAGRKRERIEVAIREFKPEGKEAEKIKQEAVKYLEGKLFKKFEGLV